MKIPGSKIVWVRVSCFLRKVACMARLFSRKVALMSTFNCSECFPKFPSTSSERSITSKVSDDLIGAKIQCYLKCWPFFFQEIIGYLDVIYWLYVYAMYHFVFALWTPAESKKIFNVILINPFLWCIPNI